MTTGQEWQFRPYKWTEPKELFAHGGPGPHSRSNRILTRMTRSQRRLPEMGERAAKSEDRKLERQRTTRGPSEKAHRQVYSRGVLAESRSVDTR